MAHQVQAQVRLHMTSGVPEDDVINTWTFDGGDVGATPADVANDSHDDLEVFYDALVLGAVFPPEVATTIDVKWYNLADPVPGRQPILERTMGITAGGGTGLPHECAITLSFEADPVAGMRPQWLRGRVFIGPLATSVKETVGGKVLVTAAVRDVIRDAAAALQAAGDVDSHWAIYSPTFHHGRGATSGGKPGGAGPLPAVDPHSLADAVNDVSSGWVDNAFDVIRSRGEKATVRDTWT